MGDIQKQRDKMASDLDTIICKNLNKLKVAMGLSNKELSGILDLSEAAVSNYLKGKTRVSLAFLVVLCQIDSIKKAGYDFKLEDFLSESFDPRKATDWKAMYQEGALSDKLSCSFAGNFFCYLFDQSKPQNAQDVKAQRELRFGVISIHNTFDGIKGELKNHVYARFFKEDEFTIAINEKNDLDKLFQIYAENQEKRHSSIQEHFREADRTSDKNKPYYGNLEFRGKHAFISIESSEYFDQALIILRSTSKQANRAYSGGLGVVTSVAHGNDHMPTAQKILVSKYALNKYPKEEIAQYLSMASVSISPTSESIALGNLCKQMYSSNDELVSLMTDDDKLSIVTSRVSQLIHNYINKNICCVASVSKEEDEKVYKLIQQAAKDNDNY